MKMSLKQVIEWICTISLCVTYTPILAQGFPSEATAALEYVPPLLMVFSLVPSMDFGDV